MHQTTHLDGIGVCQCECGECMKPELATTVCICTDCDQLNCGLHETS